MLLRIDSGVSDLDHGYIVCTDTQQKDKHAEEVDIHGIER